MTKQINLKRYALCVLGLLIMALGVAITKKGNLGVSPISSVANVMSLRFTVLSMGNWLILWNCVLILGQIVVLRKDFQWYQLLQLPLSFLFGWFTDLGLWLVSFLPVTNYAMQLGCVLVGVVVLGLGVSLTVIANVIMNSGEALVKAFSDTTGKEFGSLKIAFDVFCVILAAVISLLSFHFRIVGIREGTVIHAFCTGLTVRFFIARLKAPLEKVLG